MFFDSSNKPNQTFMAQQKLQQVRLFPTDYRRVLFDILVARWTFRRFSDGCIR